MFFICPFLTNTNKPNRLFTKDIQICLKKSVWKWRNWTAFSPNPSTTVGFCYRRLTLLHSSTDIPSSFLFHFLFLCIPMKGVGIPIALAPWTPLFASIFLFLELSLTPSCSLFKFRSVILFVYTFLRGEKKSIQFLSRFRFILPKTLLRSSNHSSIPPWRFTMASGILERHNVCWRQTWWRTSCWDHRQEEGCS